MSYTDTLGGQLGLSWGGQGIAMPGMGSMLGAGALGVGALGVIGALDPSLLGGGPNYLQYSPGAVPSGFQYDPSQIVPTQTNMLGGISNLGGYNIGAPFLPAASTIGSNLLGNYGAPQAFTGAGAGYGYGQGGAANAYGAGGAIYNTAFDPQSQLYNQYLGLTTDQARANASAAGLGTTPVGVAGVDWAQNQFNNQWLNYQLGRQIQGAQAAAPLQSGAATTAYTTGAYPWQTAQNIGSANLGTISGLNQIGQGSAYIPQQQIGDWSTAFGQMLGAQQQGFGQAQTGWQDQLARAQLQFQEAQAQNQAQAGTLGGLGQIAGTLGTMAMFA